MDNAEGLGAGIEPAVDGIVVPRRVMVQAFTADEECLVYHPERDEATALNRTATEIWELCDGTATVHAIAAVLAERYGIAAALLAGDVAAGLLTLRHRGLVEFEAPRPISA